ncbi:NADH-quinone oxidoreductase subunit NuoK [Wohlfahrtiimonas chitiniclastica]|uniref:NADH-quinone oxidoreductase subunit K n=2 Tax=Wohlfahrtiimonas chitiniclastica TaxID=400946 RepID=L8XZY7_9GAMM|nr:NADH-quinone oxidoreductase subunit NuoK [Wohlfahrtiimonas chitiniclastica]ELV07856.1 NADH-quinone oxidoreductase subunit K [Wohlfahrtiimonas chitiniclastica SH04]KZS23483.1 NADH-quinone oxidoreductase subunit K [Wohlfahrtiimonas chitiniclastica]KZX36913.1 NADH-quinone oxidoreductase subunit K [Wohlfahrtiimonas chitiniclastica]MBS7815387.1 NADH-quinone oxidoreductase subunit NuoK [Wohlfahrtiimonas chitiniclastica]MBS7817435.1 NADH-quinone oxidoreductase subunit NuoK [Wohlfahrtiimonas chitin
MQLLVTDYIMLASTVFCLGMAGIFINRKNIVVLLMSIELMLLASNILFVAFSKFSGNFMMPTTEDPAGQVFVLFTLAVAAAEIAIGLAILVLVYRKRQTINVDEMDELKG